jgi:hypothetical protein
VIFFLVIVWAFMGYTMAQFQLLPLYETPHIWIAWAAFILASIIPAITPVVWRMKTQIIYVEPEWDFREREVSQSEYRAMVKQYRNEYRDFLSIVDYRLTLLAIVIALTAIVTPFLLMRTNFFIIAATPVIFGILVLLFGLVCSSILFKSIPNEATPHFPVVTEKVLHSSIERMQTTPGISWAGVSMTLGEASGYYTIRDANPISRIEGVESVAKIRGLLDESGNVSKIVSTLSLDDMDEPKVIEEHIGEATHRQLTEIVHKTLQAYIETRGEDEILDEVLEEVTDFLKQFDDSDSS